MDLLNFKPYIKELIKYYYELPDNGAGGNLHIVLDDGNVDYRSIYFCQEECEKSKDTFGYFLCELLSYFLECELEKMYNDNWWGMRKNIDLGKSFDKLKSTL